MILNDIYLQLSHGELRQLFMANDPDTPDQPMSEESFQKLFPTIDLGLTALHTRFKLREGSLQVELQQAQTQYKLTMDFAESNNRSREPVKYIKDQSNPFQDDLIQVERVYGTLGGEEYEIPLNKLNDSCAIRTSKLNTLVIPSDPEKAPWLDETTELKVVYRQNHPKLNAILANSSPLATEIDLPVTHLEPLLYFVASRQLNPMGMDPGAMHEGNNYFAKYEHACQRLEDEGIELSIDAGRDVIYEDGWA